MKTQLKRKQIRSLHNQIQESNINKIIKKIEFLSISDFEEFQKHSLTKKYTYHDLKNILGKFNSMKIKESEPLKFIFALLEEHQKIQEENDEYLLQSSEEAIKDLRAEFDVFEGEEQFYSCEKNLKKVLQAFLGKKSLKNYFK